MTRAWFVLGYSLVCAVGGTYAVYQFDGWLAAGFALWAVAATVFLVDAAQRFGTIRP